MLKLVHAFTFTLVLVAGVGNAAATTQEGADGAGLPEELSIPHKKKAGDVSYRTMWSMQKRVASMVPKDARMISPILRLSVDGMVESERTEYQPGAWSVAIVGKTVGVQMPLRRGGYFEVPALPQAQNRNEDAIVTFNSVSSKNQFDVGWNVHIPSTGTLAYTQFGQALTELKQAQRAMPWWDIMATREKTARFDAMRACFRSEKGKILVAGLRAGVKLSAHCELLVFDPVRVNADPTIDFVGDLDFVTLDNSENYPVTVAAAD